MDYDVWANNVFKNIAVFADTERQRKGWIDGDISAGTFGWYDEICDLFDSNAFEEFIDQNRGQLGDILPGISELKDKLKAYQGHEDDSDILGDPEWIEISDLARKILTKWNLRKRKD